MKRTLLVLILCMFTAVIQLAQRPPQGEEFKKWMQDIQSQLQAFTEAYNSMDVAKASTAVNALQKDFAMVEAHFQKAAKADAVNWAKDSRLRMEDAQTKLRYKDIAYSLNLVQLAQKNCKACHDVYKAPPAKGR
jgi:cytochrome c556